MSWLHVLPSVSSISPANLWDHLIPQTKIALNLLWQSTATPTASAYARLLGPFAYNKMPLTPIGCKVQVPQEKWQCGTWTYHCVNGWYLNMSPGALLCTQLSHQEHVFQTSQQYSTIQTQNHHQSFANPSGQTHACHSQLQSCTAHHTAIQELHTIIEHAQAKCNNPSVNLAPLLRVQLTSTSSPPTYQHHHHHPPTPVPKVPCPHAMRPGKLLLKTLVCMQIIYRMLPRYFSPWQEDYFG